MGTNEGQRQINDAIRAGEQALASLQAANEELEQAAGYGRWDIFGGGMLPSLLKRSRMNDARGYVEDAEKALRHFQWVLRNTDVPREASEMFQSIKYEDKRKVFGFKIHSFSTRDRIKKYDDSDNEENAEKPYSIKVGETKRTINLYAIASTKFQIAV